MALLHAGPDGMSGIWSLLSERRRGDPQPNRHHFLGTRRLSKQPLLRVLTRAHLSSLMRESRGFGVGTGSGDICHVL